MVVVWFGRFFSKRYAAPIPAWRLIYRVVARLGDDKLRTATARWYHIAEQSYPRSGLAAPLLKAR